LPDSPKQSVPAMDSVFKPTLVLMCGRTVAAVAAFLIPILLVRVFAPAQYGTYKQVFLIYATLYGVFQLGMAESLYYFLPRTPALAGRYVLNAVMILLGVGFTGLWFLVDQRERIAAWLNNGELSQYLPLLGANLVFMISSAPLEIALVSRKQYRWAAALYASDVVRVLFFLVPVLLWGGLRALLAGGLAFAILRFGASMIHFAKEFGNEFRPSWTVLKEQFAYALPFELAILVEIAQTNVHQYAVAHYFDAVAFAVYSVGCMQIPLVDFFASPAGNVMMVLMSEQNRKGQQERVLPIWHDTTRKLALVFFPVTALLMIVAPDLIPLVFTQQYRESVPIFIIWMITVSLCVFQTDAVLRVFAATRFLLLLNGLRLAIVAAVLYATLAQFGIIGAVISTVVAMLSAKIIALAKIRRLLQVSIPALLPWQRLFAISAVAALACAGPLVVQKAIRLHGMEGVLLSGLSYAVIYFTSMWHFDLLSTAEKAELTSYIPRIPVMRLSAKPPCNLSEEWKG
jgi:O-antigen/teichoic acid export membrane protein